MHLLLTRPKSEDDQLPGLLQSKGHTFLSDPVLSVEFVTPGQFDFGSLQAILITSSNALRALAASPDLDLERLRDLPLYAVGSATAAHARDMGFAKIRIGQGTSEDIVRQLIEDLAPGDGEIYYPHSQQVAYDPAPLLIGAGFAIRASVVYRTVPLGTLAPNTVAGLRNGDISGVVLLSPRTAKVYASLIETAGLVTALSRTCHFCLSARVADGLSASLAVPIKVAAHPNLQELVALIGPNDTHSAGKAPGPKALQG